MTTEQLLQPRYKVIEDYPGSEYKIGEVFPDDFDGEDMPKEHLDFTMKELGRFPHLFRKLQWWEDRDVKDMPEYVNHLAGVHKVNKWNMTGSGAKCLCEKGTELYHAERVLPATIDEYQQYLKSKIP